MSMQPNEHESFDFSDGGPRHDPVFESILEDIEISQSELSIDTRKQDIRSQVTHLNELLGSTGWVGTTVRYSGRLRNPMSNIEESSSEARQFIGEHGGDVDDGTVDVENEPLILTPIDLDIDLDEVLDPTIARYGFTFTTPESLELVEDDSRDIITESPGFLFAYPEDIKQLEVSIPSPEATENLLKLAYPAIYRQITDPGGIRLDNPNGRAILWSLKSFKLPFEDEYTEKFLSKLGDVLYARMDVDATSMYDFVLDGSILGLVDDPDDESGVSLVEREQPAGTRLRGYICKIDFMESEGAYRPIMIVAEQSAQFDDGDNDWEMRIIPIDSVTRLQWGREREKRFGEAAVVKFDDPESVARFWNKRVYETTEVTAPEDGSTHEDALFSMLEDDFEESFYNEDYGFHERDVSEDLTELLKTLQQNSLEDIEVLFDRALEGCLYLHKGDRIATKEMAIFHIDEKKGRSLKPTLLGSGACIIGTIDGVSRSLAPDNKEALGLAADANRDEVFNLILKDVTVLHSITSDKYDKEPMELRGMLVHLPIEPDKIVKVEFVMPTDNQ